VRFTNGRIVLIRLHWITSPPVKTFVIWNRDYALNRWDVMIPVFISIPALPPPRLANAFGFFFSREKVIASPHPYAFALYTVAIPYWLPTLLSATPLLLHFIRRTRTNERGPIESPATTTPQHLSSP
jgi:hypothetical protein